MTFRSFIKSNDQFIVFNEIPNIVSETNEIPIMTSNTTPSGIARASSYSSSDSRYAAFRAFNNITNDGNNAWVSTSASNEWLEYEFPNDVIIGAYSIAPNVLMNNSQPKTFDFQAYDGTNWRSLDSRNNINSWAANTHNTFEVKNIKPFRRYRIIIYSNNGTSYISISSLKMYRVITAGLPPHWQTISTTLPPEDIFMSKGMPNLSVLDRQLTTFTIPMDENTPQGQPLGDGKMFKEKINLKKYMEINSINVK